MSSDAAGGGWPKQMARQVLFPLAEAGWAAGFGLAGRVLRPTVRRVEPTGQDRVLVIAPHPDDETLGCGGTLARHLAAGDRVSVLIVTDGGRSRAGGHGTATIRALRRAEAAAALARLGPVELMQWDLPEGAWPAAAFQARCAALLDAWQPTLLYVPSWVDFHPEHRRVAEALAATLATPPAGLRALRIYELSVPLTPLLANVGVDIRATHAAKWHALAAYQTQVRAFAWLPRHERHLRRLYRATGPLEVFGECTPAQYRALGAAARGRERTWRGLRIRPFSDGLAWGRGLITRRRLRRAAFDNL